MKDPSEVAQSLGGEFLTRNVEKKELRGPGPAHEGERWEYIVVLNSSRSTNYIRESINSVEDHTDVPLTCATVRPIIEQSDTSIDARLQIIVREESDRNELCNHSLNDWSNRNE